MAMKGLVLHEYHKIPQWEDTPKPQPQPGQLLVKVQAAGMNPADRLRLENRYFPKEMHKPMGLEGTGIVVEANGPDLQNWIGKRVSFMAEQGSWAEFALASPDLTMEIDADVPLHCAAFGVSNPLTAIGFVDVYRQHNGVGLINTAAASALGRMLNKLCQKENIPLLNVVRKPEQAELLRSEGASLVLVTTGEWVEEYRALCHKHHFNVLFDALGGGPVTEALAENIQPPPHHQAWMYVYGMLENKPLSLGRGGSLFRGLTVSAFGLPGWWRRADPEKKKRIRADHSRKLKEELYTTPYKTLKMSEVAEAFELSQKEPLKGKITMLP